MIGVAVANLGKLDVLTPDGGTPSPIRRSTSTIFWRAGCRSSLALGDTIVVAMDWTDFDADRQATIMLALITDHGRSTPLVWLIVDKKTLKDHRALYEHLVLVRLAELLPAGITVCIVADRGFGEQKLYKMLTEELYFDYVIRFRGNIAVTAACGETRSAAAWVRAGGRARVLRGFSLGDGIVIRLSSSLETRPHYGFDARSGLPVFRSTGTETCSCTISHLPLIFRYTSVTRTVRSIC
jgi:hypothetical protein